MKVIPAVKYSLRALQLDYLDLYLIHWPVAVKVSNLRELVLLCTFLRRVPLISNNIFHCVPAQPGKDEDDNNLSRTVHNPENANVTLEDTWRAMEEVVRQGFAKSIGVSNFNKSQLERILKIAKIKPVVNQVSVHEGRRSRIWTALKNEENLPRIWLSGRV